MAKKHTYVLGINAYDHDVSACLLRDGEIAFAIAKERITREKHATGFYRGSRRLLPEGRRHHARRRRSRRAQLLRAAGRGPGDAAALRGRARVPGSTRSASSAKKHPLYLSKSDKVVTVSHHLAHAYSAFAACPFEEGVVMVVDGVGSYCADVTRAGPADRGRQPARARIGELLPFKGSKLETLKKVWLEPTRGFLSDEFYFMPGLGALYSRVSSYIFADWNKCGEVMGLAPYGAPRRRSSRCSSMQGRRADVPRVGRRVRQAVAARTRTTTGKTSPSMQHWEDMAWRVQDDTEKVLLDARQVAARDDGRQEPVHRRRRRPQLRRQRPASCARPASTTSGSSRRPATTASPSAAPTTAISRSRRSRAPSS